MGAAASHPPHEVRAQCVSPVSRVPCVEEYAHERLGAQFDARLERASYDTRRRMEVLIDEFLSPMMLQGKSVLDVGCGPGFFSERLVRRGARVTACDLGPSLVERTAARAGCDGVVADALALTTEFGCDRFDVVVCSECIEHTPAPAAAVKELIGVLAPGGYLALSTPNIVWQPLVRAASAMRLRPYDGFEHFSSWAGLLRAVEHSGASVVASRGLHLFPFQFGLHAASRWCDAHLQALRGAMINICVLARKRS